MKPERMLCLWCPDWPVVAARRADPSLDGVPVVVLDRGFVLAASVEARAEGVRRGLRRREAEVRCPGLVIRPVDTRRRGPGLRGPQPGGRSAGAPPGPRPAGPAVRADPGPVPLLRRRRSLRHPAPGRGGRRLAGAGRSDATRDRGRRRDRSPPAVGGPAGASRAGAFVVPAGESAAFLAPWPVRVLDDDDLASLLVRLGLPTLGNFAGLPGASVLGRFGPVGLAAHRRARGEDEHPPALRVPPPELELHHEFDPPVSRVDTAVFAGRALAERLLEELAADGLMCTRVRVEAETEHGERLARSWRLSGQCRGPGSHRRRGILAGVGDPGRAGAGPARGVGQPGRGARPGRRRPQRRRRSRHQRAHAPPAGARGGRRGRAEPARPVGRRPGRRRAGRPGACPPAVPARPRGGDHARPPRRPHPRRADRLDPLGRRPAGPLRPVPPAHPAGRVRGRAPALSKRWPRMVGRWRGRGRFRRRRRRSCSGRRGRPSCSTPAGGR